TDNAGNSASGTAQYTVFTPLKPGSNTCTGIVGGSGGSLTVPAGANCIVLPGATLTGDANVGKGSTFTCTGASIGHDLHSENSKPGSAPIDIGSAPACSSGNQVGHDMHIEHNSDVGVVGNQVVHDAMCQNNDIQNGSGNTAGHNVRGCNASTPPAGTVDCSAKGKPECESLLADPSVVSNTQLSIVAMDDSPILTTGAYAPTAMLSDGTP